MNPGPEGNKNHCPRAALLKNMSPFPVRSFNLIGFEAVNRRALHPSYYMERLCCIAVAREFKASFRRKQASGSQFPGSQRQQSNKSEAVCTKRT